MKYPFSVFQTQVDSNVFWIAKSSVLKGCVGQGDNLAEAVAELAENEQEWIDTANEVGIPIPEIPIQQTTEYSGKISLRIAPSIHQRAVQLAKIQGISLNQYINDAIVAKNSELSAVNYISRNVVNFVQALNDRFFTKTSSVASGDQNPISVPITQPYMYHVLSGKN